MDEPLAKIVSGTFDVSAAAAKHREDKETQKALVAVFGKLGKLLQANETKEALTVVDKELAANPKLEFQLGMLKYDLMLKAGDGGSSTYGRKLVEGLLKDNAEALNAIAWGIVDPSSKRDASKRDVKLALLAATRANELKKGEDPAILDTLAKATFDSGDVARAVELQEKAVKLSPDADPEMKARLEEYRKAAKEKAGDAK